MVILLRLWFTYLVVWVLYEATTARNCYLWIIVKVKMTRLYFHND